jgi:long-chain acyl-CoA synthetase
MEWAMTQTIPRMIFEQARRFGDKTALRYKTKGHYLDISWQEFEKRIRAYALGLMALGVAPGDRVAIMSRNCPEWACADLGAMAAGAITVPVYHTEGIQALKHIIGDSGSRVLFLQSPLTAAEIVDQLDEIPSLEQVILFEDRIDLDRFLSLDQFLAGADTGDDKALEERIAGGGVEDTATIVYTSGTTGLPKGAMLTHLNILANVRDACSVFAIGPDDVCLSFLPLSHVFERVDGYYLMLHQGAVIAYAESIDTVPANLLEVRPTVVISVPRLYEKMFARVMERVLDGPWLNKQLFFGALKIGRAYAAKTFAGEEPGALLKAGIALARKAVFSKLQERLGGRLRFFISGGAPLVRNVAEFFFAADIPVYEGYGLTETAAGIAVNTPDHVRLETVGRPFPSTEIKIADDGEILVRGPGIFKGYWQDPERDAEVFEDDWFKTGDIGELDADGFLAITDRKKDLIVTAGGENIAPQNLENAFKSDKFISNALVYGDRKPFLTALIVPNFDNLEKYANYKGIDFLNHCDLVSHPRVLDLIRRRLDRLQQDRPSHSQIKRFTLLSRDFSAEENEITPTMKIKRKVVKEHFARILEGMYRAKDHGDHDSGFCAMNGGKED